MSSSSGSRPTPATSDVPARIALVVVNYGSCHLLRVNLVRTADGLPGALVVVVDNPTTTAERAAVVELCQVHGWEVVLPAVNGGFGDGMNLGAERAASRGATVLVLLNPDLEVEAAAVARLVERATARPRALVAPQIIRPDGSVWSAGTDLDLADGRMRSIAGRDPLRPGRRRLWLSGACLVLSSRLWSEVGGFAAEYFLYWEDVELSHRVLAAGGTLEVCDDAVAVHAEGGTQDVGQVRSGQRKSRAYYYYNTRNRMLFAARVLDVDDVRRWRRSAWPVAREILLQGGRRQLLESLSPLAAVVRGTAAGLRLSSADLRRRRQRGQAPDAG